MNRHQTMILAVLAAASLGAAAAPELQTNPLMRPAAPKAAATPAPSAATGPSLSDAPNLPAPVSIGKPGSELISDSSRLAAHLSGLRVVATIGEQAILRGPMGRGLNFALSKDGGGGSAGSPGSSPSGAGESISITVSHGKPVQIGESIWVRPEVQGSLVRLFFQSSAKGGKDKSEALVYSSQMEVPSHQQRAIEEEPARAK